jgi:hypothetical protein
MTPDPYASNTGGPGDPSDPQSWNKYAYTRGDPVNRVDPDGLADFSITTWAQLQNQMALWGLLTMSSGVSGTGSEKGQRNTYIQSYAFSYNQNMRSMAISDFKNLGPGCQKALGKLWDLTNDANGVLTKINNIFFFNGSMTASAGGVSDVAMSAFGYTFYGASTDSVAEYLEDMGAVAFVSIYNNTPGNLVVLTSQASSALFGAPYVIHEVLHSYTGKDDLALAQALGLGSLITAVSQAQQETQASGLITGYLQADCDKSKLQ